MTTLQISFLTRETEMPRVPTVWGLFSRSVAVGPLGATPHQQKEGSAHD